jgi:transposase
VVPDDEMVALRLMSERRRDLVRSRTQTVNHLHQLLMELIAAGAGRNLTAKKAKALLATIRPRDVAGRTRRQLAVDLIEDLVGLDRKLTALDKRLKAAVAATGTTLTDIKGVGTAIRGDDPRRGRGRPPVPVPAPLRHLRRGRPDRGVLR